MAYHDEQGGKDNKETRQSLNHYETTSEESSSSEESRGQEQESHGRKSTRSRSGTGTTEANQSGSGGRSREGLLSRMRRAMFGDATMGQKAKAGWLSFLGSGGFSKALIKLAAPKILAALVCGSGIGLFGILGIFNTYKNDGMIRNDPPLQCEQGELELPGTGQGADNDKQANVDIMYDIFCNQFGYSEEFLVGMLACMSVESDINPDRLESDFILTAAKEAFNSAAGPDSGASADTTKEAYWTYGQAFQSGGGWNGNDFYLVDGKMCCGIGLIQWTAGRALNLIEGIDKVSMDVSVMDLHYQCAFLLAEFKTSYEMCSPDNVGSVNAACSSDEEATKFFFKNIVSGGSLNDVDKRLAFVDECRGFVDAAAANAEFTQDTVTMAEILADDGFTAAVAKSSNIQLCKNKTFVDVSDIAKAAVSISFLERGDYEDVHGAYGEYRRSSRSPLLINDWDFVEGQDGSGASDEPVQNGTYGDRGAADPKGQLKYYEGGAGPGKQDLIACTEYYYYAHLIAFPKETGRGGNAGYFSSCDRGTGTAVRIAGADDKFPAGNPLGQLAWACGAAKEGAKHNSDDRGPQGKGFLWDFSGFLRGCDYYSASGGNAISPGTVMISWSDDAANGYLDSAGSAGATDSGDGNDSGVIVPGPDGDPIETDPDDPTANADEAKMKIANLRWPFSVSNTSRHIITFVGEGAVQDFWGIDWLYQQWGLFDDADRLIRGDLNVEVPEVMKKGMSFKSSYGSKAGNQKETFYKAQADGAQDNGDVKDGFAGRQVEFNAKTGLPEFHAWEQIFVRLLHNSDDDAAAGLTEAENELWVEFETDEDNYLDEAEDKIEQYQNKNTFANKYFQEDWNSIGAGEFTDPYADDYSLVSGSDLLYYDDWSDKWTHEKDAGAQPYWRYELITDIEYRMNQFLRFGLASMMCSVASEEDADVVQTGSDMSNDTGLILGNLYRRYSRIPDEIDASGRYYYANTVMSNDMLQDLCQLYTNDRNGDAEGNGGGYQSRNYGPMYLLGDGSHGYGYDSAMTASGTANANWKDRRYGLTAVDIENIMAGLGGMKMGMADGDAVADKLTAYINRGLHEMSAVEAALYERTVMSETVTDTRGAHEGDHEFTTGDVYESELYGINPFLMLESDEANHLNYDQNPGVGDHSAKTGSTQGLRNSIDGTIGGKMGVDADNDKMDDRLAWIDRHYYVTAAGNIGTRAYAVAGMNPSTGKQISGDYLSAIQGVKTLDATGTYGSGDSDNLKGSRGVVRYTDYIYAENKADNLDKDYSMANRLFGDDDRYGNDTVRDDYNQREWMVVPYRHTHSQACQHSHDGLLQNHTVNNWPAIQNGCEWWADNAGCTDPDILAIDTQTYLNGLAGSDHGDTCSFDNIVDNRGKYNVKEHMINLDVKYYAYNFSYVQGDDHGGSPASSSGWGEIEILDDCVHAGGMWPPGHVGCDGKTFCNSSNVTCQACISGPPLGHDCEEQCPIPGCSAGCHHWHSCHELMQKVPQYDHGHTECKEGNECHDKWGCNILEYLYHNNKAVYMAMPIVKDPVEDMDLTKFKTEYTSGGTCYPDKHNFLQAITYKPSTGGIHDSFEALVSGTGSLADPNPSLTPTRHKSGDVHFTLSDAGGYAIGYDAGGKKSLLGYFTIEGNLIRSSMGDTSSEEITEYAKNCGAMDLQRLESMKFRVGRGKSLSQTVSVGGGTTSISQEYFSTASGLGEIQYSTLKPDDNTSATGYNGYGEVAVVGAQHEKDPTENQGNYAGGDNHTDMGSASGPDGSKGNNKVGFKSLLREIIGDEHVAHVTFGSQDPVGLTDPTKDNGRDFMVYGPDHKKWNEKLDADGVAEDDERREPAWYQKPGNTYDGKVVTPEITPEMTPAEKRTAYNNSWSKSLSPFVDMDGDPKYLDPVTGLPTDKRYYDNEKRAVTDEEVNESGNPNEENVELRSSGSGDGIIANNETGAASCGCSGNGGDSAGTGTDGKDTYTNNGDYRLWVTHASRGTRGMMTQYLNFKSFFKYVHNSSDNSKEMAYMLFTNVKRQDGFNFGSEDADGDGDVLEDFVYSSSPGDAVIDSPNRVWGTGSEFIKDEDGNIIGIKPTHFSDTYGQGSNSHWKNLIEVYNAAMSETRHFD